MDVQTHVYERDIDPAKAQDSLGKIFRAINPGASVLDVGVGSGSLGRWLKIHKAAVVDGITYNEAERELAAQSYRHLYLVDLESQGIPVDLQDKRYDYVVFADVLEHLRNAQTVLLVFQTLLKPNGRFIISVPHVGHSAVVLNLLDNRIERSNEGLLDATHVHLMDRRGLVRMIHAAGLKIEHEDAVRRSTADSEFRGQNWRHVPLSVREYTEARPDADLYQFIWTLSPNTGEKSETTRMQESHATTTATYALKLYWSAGGVFDETNSTVCFAPNSDDVVDCVLDGRWTEVPKRLRLNVADQLGVAELVGLTALSGEQSSEPVWQWLASAAGCTSHGLRWLGGTGPHGGALVQVVHRDAHLILDIGEQLEARGVWSRLVWRASAPNPLVNADTLNNRQQLNELAGQLNQAQSAFAEQLALSTQACAEQVVLSTRALDIAQAVRFEQMAIAQHSVADAQAQVNSTLLARAQHNADQLSQETQRLVYILEAQRTERQTLEASLMTLSAQRHMSLLDLAQASATAAHTTIPAMKAMLEHLHEDMQHRLAQAEHKQAELAGELARVYASRSWALTVPVRKLAAWSRRLLGRG